MAPIRFLSQYEEVRRMGIEKIYIDLDVEVGDTVKVINGPFESFMGVVEEVNMEKQTLTRQNFDVRKRYACRTGIRTGR